MSDRPELKVVDASGLTDADWIGINKVALAYEAGGVRAFWDEIDKLGNPAVRIRVAGAFFPDLIREAIKDEMARQGLTVEDLRELLRKNESPAGDQ
jgi:hypothetical protein